MNGLAILIPVALSLGLAGLAVFFWSLRNRQYDDLDGAALRILDEDDVPLAERQITSLAERQTLGLAERQITSLAGPNDAR